MRYGDKYKHCKGGEYYFLGIALPIKGSNLPETTLNRMSHGGSVRYHENTHDIDLYFIDEIMFIDSDKPHVIYQSLKDDKNWAREVDDYFGYKNIEGIMVKKFQVIEPAELF